MIIELTNNNWKTTNKNGKPSIKLLNNYYEFSTDQKFSLKNQWTAKGTRKPWNHSPGWRCESHTMQVGNRNTATAIKCIHKRNTETWQWLVVTTKLAAWISPCDTTQGTTFLAGGHLSPGTTGNVGVRARRTAEMWSVSCRVWVTITLEGCLYSWAPW